MDKQLTFSERCDRFWLTVVSDAMVQMRVRGRCAYVLIRKMERLLYALTEDR